MSDRAPVTPATPVDFWFDPMCPWAWMASRWVLEVQKARDIEIRWHLMSLAILNEDKLDELPEDIRELLETKGWGPVRVVIAAHEEHGAEVIGDLYTAIGRRVHNQGEELGKATVGAALKEVGLPDSLLEHWDSTPYERQLRASHQEGIDKVGQEVGTPVIAVPGTDVDVAFFGPVVTPAPQGEDAVRLWDGVLAVASVPGFYEIKRTRTTGPDFSNL
ncbi:DsbA family protein [Streptomyces sp. NPDC006645]|uniref:mycothiol-dependent nitroreductase Rv2466c family protein n=1 Tax=unclassified Streptomyces TaxID=2593676 RepID=UPI0033A6BAE8